MITFTRKFLYLQRLNLFMKEKKKNTQKLTYFKVKVLSLIMFEQ